MTSWDSFIVGKSRPTRSPLVKREVKEGVLAAFGRVQELVMGGIKGGGTVARGYGDRIIIGMVVACVPGMLVGWARRPG